jgi:hypothetical protein
VEGFPTQDHIQETRRSAWPPYRLWQVTGDFKNDFDLRRYPADRQTLVMRFFNANAASDRIVYVRDRLSQAELDGSRACCAFELGSRNRRCNHNR